MDWKSWEEREKLYACWLCNFPAIGNKQLYRLYEVFGGTEGIYYGSREEWEQVLSAKQADALKEFTACWHPEEEYRRMREQGIQLILFGEKGYPRRLKNIPDPPFGLFVKGHLPGEDVPAVAVVGARECSEYGRYVAKQLGAVLGKCGVTVISGMAKGIDGISQEEALRAGGSSAAVLGCGVDICYPQQNRKLYECLAVQGAVISSYPLGTAARQQNFPPRNRIVSGMADVVVVIEARVKSGTLITVDMALEQGREVYVVPGRVTDRLSDGCNRLIKQGAGILLDPEMFVEELWELWVQKGGYRREGVRGADKGGISNAGMSEEERMPPEMSAVYAALDFEPRTPEEIRGKLPDQYRNLQIVTCLMKLCMEKKAIQVSPGRFGRKG